MTPVAARVVGVVRNVFNVLLCWLFLLNTRQPVIQVVMQHDTCCQPALPTTLPD